MIARLARLERAGLFIALRGEDLIGDRLGDGEFLQGRMIRMRTVGRGMRNGLAGFEFFEPGIDRVETGLNSRKIRRRPFIL